MLIELNKYCSSVRDGTHDTPKPNDDGFFLVTSKSINDNNIDFSSCYKISKEDYDKVNKRSKVEKRDVLMTMIGSVGRMLLVKDDPEYAIKNIALFKIGDEYKAKWLYYYFSTKNVQNYLEAVANGTSQHFVGLNYLRKFKINDYNESSEQIINILSKFDEQIENNNKRVKILEEMAEQIYKEWFVRFRFPGYENSEFIDEIPKGWGKKKLSEFIIFERGVSYGSNDLEDGGYVLLSMNNIKPYGGFISDYSRLYCGKFKEHQLVKKGDLLMSITDMTQDRRIIGYTGLVGPGEDNRIISMHLLKLHSEKYSNIFLNYLFNCSGLSRVIAERATGTNVLGMTVDILNNVRCILPPEDLAKLYTEKVSPIIDLINKIEEKNNKLIEQRDLLLPRLMSGKLEVK